MRKKADDVQVFLGRNNSVQSIDDESHMRCEGQNALNVQVQPTHNAELTFLGNNVQDRPNFLGNDAVHIIDCGMETGDEDQNTDIDLFLFQEALHSPIFLQRDQLDEDPFDYCVPQMMCATAVIICGLHYLFNIFGDCF